MAGNINKWSKTAATNSNADSTINWAEGQAPSTVNDSARALMAAVADDRDDTRGAITTGGTLTAYTITTNSVNVTHQRGLSVSAKLSATSGLNPTLNLDGLGAKKIFIPGSAGMAQPAAGALIIGDVCTFVYDTALDAAAGGWIVQNYSPLTIALLGATTAQLTTNDGTGAPAAGKIGETISSNIVVGSGVTPAAATAANITSISLTAGTWSVSGNVGCLVGAGSTQVTFQGWISTTSATLPTSPNSGAIFNASITLAAATGSTFGVSPIIITVSTTTTTYLGGRYTLSAGSNGTTLYGAINATRIG